MSDYTYAENNEDSVGQDEGDSKQEGSGEDWKEQAKYFQSEKDKLYVENESLRKHAQIGQFLQERPEIAKKLSTIIKDHNGDDSSSEKKPDLGKEEFNSWEALNDPSSESYKQREDSLQENVDKAVSKAVGKVTYENNAKEGMKKMVELMNARGYNEQDKVDFFKFASNGPQSYGFDGALDMFEAVEREQISEGDNPNNIVRRNQKNPIQGGILQGQQPVRKNDSDDLWKGIMDAQPLGKDGKLP